MDRKAKDEGGGNSDDGVKGNEKELDVWGGGEDTAGGDDEGGDDDGEFAEGAKKAEGKGLGVASGDFGAVVDEAGDRTGDVEFGTFVAIVEEKHNNRGGDEDAGDDTEDFGGEWETE